MLFKKWFLLVLAMIISITSLSGCNESAGTGVKGEKVRIKYVLPGPGKQEDSVKVWNLFNEKLQKKLPNVEVEFEIFSIADYKKQFLLMQTSRETIDIVNDYGLSFAEEVMNGTFAEMDELVQKYGKEVSAALPKWLFDYMRVDGKLYGIPSYQMLMTPMGIRTQKEYADKYLNMETLQEAISVNDKDMILKTLEEYLENLKKDGKLFLGVDHWATIYNDDTERLLGNYVVNINDENPKVTYSFQTEAAKADFARCADWFKKGYIRKDSLSAKDQNQKTGIMDGYVLWSGNYTPWVEEIEKKKYGIDIVNIPLSNKYFIGNTNVASGTSIMTSSKYKKEAMQVLNLLQTDKELYNLLVYGIEGEHYTKSGDDKITTPYGGQGSSSDKYGLWKWIVGNTSISYSTQEEPEGYKKWAFEEVNTSPHRSKFIGFVPDTTKIADKLAQVEAVKGGYFSSLKSGSLPNWEQIYDDWMHKIMIAGNDEIIAELQRLVDEFLASKK